ncbi:MAPEG family protein [Thalassotalea piscium]|uniref:MAPEG family protein n=1 Tax=Thalassotalea piscium TaxID=1230533 RepID=A0A7X0NIY1_9GAMM|nr:MAPEG family protein [Thalassotalea piscium]MBB6544327.1 hypothetical protein [Thalassotalea piscium]
MLYPMAAMVLLLVLVGLVAVKARFGSVKRGEVSAKYFRLMEGKSVPDVITKSTRSFNNQFELPVLFYVVCTLYISLGINSDIGVAFAWAFVVSRYIHAYIHLSYNYVIHRMLSFWAGFICVLVLWINLLIQQS